jgi:hypothetical protein
MSFLSHSHVPNLSKTPLRLESKENARLGDPTFVPMNTYIFCETVAPVLLFIHGCVRIIFDPKNVYYKHTRMLLGSVHDLKCDIYHVS